MARNRMYTCFGTLIGAWIAIFPIMASEYSGTVKCGGMPFPGVSVIVVQGDQKIATTTDEHGAFQFRDLPDGAWTIEVEMLGFARIRKEVTVAPGTISPQFDLTFLSPAELLAALHGTPGSPGTGPARQASSADAVSPPAARNSRPQRNARQAHKPTEQASSAEVPSQNGFQRLAVNQSADSTTFSSEGALKSEESADLTQSAANSFIVQGSMSTALGLPQQNDWGIGGRGMGLGPMGAPGMTGLNVPGMNNPGGDGVTVGQTASRVPGGMGGGPGVMLGGPGAGGGPGGGPRQEALPAYLAVQEAVSAGGLAPDREHRAASEAHRPRAGRAAGTPWPSAMRAAIHARCTWPAHSSA